MGKCINCKGKSEGIIKEIGQNPGRRSFSNPLRTLNMLHLIAMHFMLHCVSEQVFDRWDSVNMLLFGYC